MKVFLRYHERLDIQYYPDLNPEPAILVQEIIYYLVIYHYLGQIICNHNDQIPNPIQGSSYVIVDKHLCQCSISAGT